MFVYFLITAHFLSPPEYYCIWSVASLAQLFFQLLQLRMGSGCIDYFTMFCLLGIDKPSKYRVQKAQSFARAGWSLYKAICFCIQTSQQKIHVRNLYRVRHFPFEVKPALVVFLHTCQISVKNMSIWIFPLDFLRGRS